jgi:hypothetical protein
MAIGPYHHHQKKARPGSEAPDTAAIKLRVPELRECAISRLEKLPSLTEIVIATDRRSRMKISKALSECQSSLVAEGEALEATRKSFSSTEWRQVSKEFQQRKEYVNDLAARAEPLFLHGTTLPVEVPITSKAHIAELLGALHHYREIFWRK